jgi:hypothetical protein
METKIKGVLLLFVISVIPLVFLSCSKGGGDYYYSTENKYIFNFKLSDDSAVFKTIYYNSVKEPGFYLHNVKEWRIILEPSSTKVVFETSKGWDTLVYRVVLSSPSPSGTKGGEDLIMNMEKPEILYHTFDSVYYQKTLIFSDYYDVNLILVK